MPPPPQQHPGMQEPSITSKLTMGAISGGLVGLTIGFIFGFGAVMRSGAGPKGVLPTVRDYMLASGATFGFFMSIGSVIRTDDRLTHLSAYEQLARASMQRRLAGHLLDGARLSSPSLVASHRDDGFAVNRDVRLRERLERA